MRKGGACVLRTLNEPEHKALKFRQGRIKNDGPRIFSTLYCIDYLRCGYDL